MSWPLLYCALIVQLLWVNRDEQAIEGKLLNHLIWSRARFQRWRHKTSRPPYAQQWQELRATASKSRSFAKSYFHWDIFTPRWMDIKCQKAGLPSLSEGCPHLFQSWASAHQPLSISISRLEICLESRQVLLGINDHFDLWILRHISIIRRRTITGGCNRLSLPGQSTAITQSQLNDSDLWP